MSIHKENQKMVAYVAITNGAGAMSARLLNNNQLFVRAGITLEVNL